MDSYSSIDKLNIKTRKPYTITKQRERWTGDEHNSFLEALKLYGRAWQRIEEHIGTKTAVQIRSHAQKFFTKLEKEAVAKGVPIRQTLDIEIPPPRPKRKPNYPYPRKTGHPQTTLFSSLQSCKQILDLERKPQETSNDEEKLENTKTGEETENACASLSSENENFIPKLREFVPASLEDGINHDEVNQSYITIETREHRKSDEDVINNTFNTLLFEAHEHIIQGQCSHKPSLSINDIQGVQNYPRHVPVQVVDKNVSVAPAPPEMPFHESTLNKSGEVVNIAASASASSYPAFHPLVTPFCDNKENYSYVSSTISSLIVSSLLQNPATHAAASFAAKFWHPAVNTEAGDSFSRDHLNHETPSMAAIAAATVAAATAWWTAHGLLPLSSPFYPFGNGNQATVDINGREKEAPLEDITEPSPVDTNETTTVTVGELHDLKNTTSNVQKQVDRSSCGSNTTSSSEIEMDALEKHVTDKEESFKGGIDVNVPCNDSISRRSRGTITPNESWKEVSEEGRIAFQALFSRQVLPQSFGVQGDDSNGFQMGFGNVKLNINHHTAGFKPYKRCSIETKTGPAPQNDHDKGAKRMRLELAAEAEAETETET